MRRGIFGGLGLGILAVIGEFTVRNFRHLQRKPSYIVRTKLEK